MTGPNTRWLSAGLMAVVALAWFGSSSMADEKLKALIVDGQNNHQWMKTTPILRKILEDSGRFSVEVATSPAKGQGIESFGPDFSQYDVVVSNYNGEPWPEETKKAFEKYVSEGGGVSIVHAANNAFPEWEAYNEMIGLGWRGPGFGDRVTLSDQGQTVRTAKGDGPGAGHGPQHEYQVVIRDKKHPITAGLPSEWMHAQDELYHGQRGPAANMTILATAYSAADQRGTAAHEPMLWVIPYGKGRVFTTVLGHADYSMKCVGFITTLLRGTEWAATGKVTLTEIPDDFPTADTVSARDNLP